MEVLNEYIASVPVTNLWHLAAGVVGMWLLFALCLIKANSHPHSYWEVSTFVTFVFAVLFTLVAAGFSTSPSSHLERQGYITDPPAFVEMLNDWELVDQQGTLFTVREREPMTDDEIKEWKKEVGR